MLLAVGLEFELSDDYEDDIYDQIAKAKAKQLAKEIPEVLIEVIGTIEDEYITNFLEDQISELTGWFHEGFSWEEQ